MNAFDTDVLTEILAGNTAFVNRAGAIPEDKQGTPVIVVEEIVRGRLNVIRQAEAGKAKVRLERAYELFEQTLRALRLIRVLSYTAQAEALYQEWRRQMFRVPTHDLRIAALCVSHSSKLISRNRRDFERVPGLDVEFWG
jgi:tRNA(fMet)-specific endonuclease VapC